MDRRKFIAGLGSLTAAGAAGIGTGAFTSVRAERDLGVEIADDAVAYLALDASESEYAEETSGTLELQFDGSNSGQNGDGLNANADSLFSNVFSIKNNGTKDIRVQLADDEGALADPLPDGPMAVYYSDSELTGGQSPVAQGKPFKKSPSPSWANDANYNEQDLAPGDKMYVHFGFYLNDDVGSLGSEASTDIADVPDDIGIYAGATSASASE